MCMFGLLDQTGLYACMLVCGDFIYTLDIIARILREVVNRERLCGTNAQACPLLDAWMREFIYTLEIVVRILNPV